MKLTKIFLLVLTCSFIGLVSCEEEASSPTGTNSDALSVQDLFPMTVGSWWMYETYETNAEGVKVGESGFDSVYVAGIETIDGFEAYEMVTVSTDAEGFTYTESMDYRYEGDKVLMYLTFEDDEMLSDIEDQWITFADLQMTTWSILDESFTKTMTEGGMDIDVDYEFNIKGSHESETTYNYLDLDYKSMAFSLIADRVESMEFKGQVISERNIDTIKTIQAKGIGKVKENQISITSSQFKNSTYYTEKVLVAYYIAD